MQINRLTIKIAIAVTVSIFLGQLMGIETPFYAGISAAITLQSKFFDTINAIKNRIAGSIIGITIGTLFVYLGGNSIILCFVGILLTTALCQTFKFDKGISVACIIFLAININFFGEIEPMFYSKHRFIDTMLGLFVVLGVQLTEILLEKLNNTENNSKTTNNNLKEIKLINKNKNILHFPFQIKKSA